MTEEPLPERRKGWEELHKLIEENQKKNDKRLSKFFLKIVIVVAVVGLTSFGGLVGVFIALGEIRDNRANFIRNACVNQNFNHDKTIDKLIEITSVAESNHPEQAGTVEDRLASTVALIDALAPKVDCDQLVKASKGQAKQPKPITTTITTESGKP